VWEMDDTIVQIRQLANRLESTSSSNERVDSLKELQSIARSKPEEVGENAMPQLLDLLHEQAGYEEYMEALDLLHRLVNHKNASAAATNTVLILGDPASAGKTRSLPAFTPLPEPSYCA
jgi:hypothetical protein